MDNFMDKLAEKYNAQDMIRANSQAETAQMQSLQDQVEAYEAVLQEMRKLNYKNTELTEKMYALVDASIEKVRTLEIEAKEGGVDTAEVSREMHAAVNEAVSEAISNMDETMARTLAESLQQPTAEMRQSNEQIIGVKDELHSTRDEVISIKDEVIGVKEEMSGVRDDIREISAATDLLIETLTKEEEEKAPQELMDKLQALSAQIEALKAEEKPAEAPQEIMDGLRDLSAQIAGLKTEEKPAEAPQEVLDKLQELSAQMESLKEEKPAEAPQEVLDKLQELSMQIEILQEEDKNKAVLEKLQELSAQVDALKDKEEEAIRFNADAFKAPEVSNQEILDAIRSAESANKDNKADLLDELKTADNAIQDRLFAIQQSNTTTEETLASVVSAVSALRDDNGPVEAPQEVMDKLEELSMQIEDLRTAEKPEEVSNQDILEAVRKSDNTAIEGIGAVAATVAALKDNNKAPQEVLDKLQELSAQMESLKEKKPAEAPQEVLDKLQELSMQIEILQEEDKNKAVLEKLQELSAQVDALKDKEEEAIRFNADAFKAPEVSNQEILDAIRSAESANKDNKADLLDELKTADNAIRDRLFAIQQSNTTTEESISSIAAAVAALRDDNTPAEAPQEVLDKLADLSEQIDALKNDVTRAPEVSNQEILEAVRKSDNTAVESIGAVAATVAALKADDQSAQVLDKVQELSAQIEALKAADQNAQVLDKIRGLSEQIADMQQESVRFHEDAVRAPEVSNQDILEAVRKSDNTAAESIGAVAATVAALKAGDQSGQVLDKVQELSTQIEALKAEDKNAQVTEKLQELSTQIEALKAEDKNAQVTEKLQALSSQIEALKADDQRAQVLEKLQALSAQNDKIYEKQQEPDEDARAAAARVAELLETLKQQAKFTELTQETLAALAQSNTQTQDSLTEMRGKLDGLSDRSAQEKNEAEMAEKLAAVQQDAKSAKEALFYLRTSSDEQKGGIEELKGLGNDTKAGLQDIYDSLEKAKKGISDIKAQQLQMLPQANEGDDEIRQALTELLSGHSDLTTGLRNVKNASDETKNTLKSTLDTAIYGLKQDNKELVGILQRMNATLTSRTNDDEKEQRKEEAERARIEEDRRLLEERFKLTEDFMHKESVKVYRNVQAVINEKNDKQREGLDSGNQNVMSSVAKVKAWAIISTIIGGANLVLIILKLFKILDF